MIAILVILAFVAAWNIAPMLMLCTLPIPWRHKLRGCKSLPMPHCAAFWCCRPIYSPRRRAICAAADWVGRRIAAALGTLVGQRRQYQRRSSSPRHNLQTRQRPAQRATTRRATTRAASMPAGCGWACATGPVRSPQCLAASSRPPKCRTRTPGATKPSARPKKAGACAATGLCTSSTSSARSACCACVSITATSSTTPASGGRPGNGGQHQL